MTAAEAARVAGCAASTMQRLLEMGKVAGTRTGLKAHWHVTATRQELREALVAHSPKSGYRKNGNGHHQAVQRTHAQPSGRLNLLLEWASLSEEKRGFLLIIGQRFTVDELQVLSTL